MTRIDQFESVFKAADKAVFRIAPVEFRSILVLTDLDRDRADEFAGRIRSFLAVLEGDAAPRWRTVAADEFDGVDAALDLVERESPDLVCTYRSLRSGAWRRGHTLGACLDVLTQSSEAAILVLPHPERERAAVRALDDTDSVMAMTDRLTGDHRLVNTALRLTQPGGRLALASVEDSDTFERYLDAIGKIPSIDTDSARESILAQLLKEPRDYVASCTEAVSQAGLDVHIEEVVRLGRDIEEYGRLVEEYDVDLLVVHTKSGDRLAMHGRVYSLAVRLRHVPLLML